MRKITGLIVALPEGFHEMEEIDSPAMPPKKEFAVMLKIAEIERGAPNVNDITSSRVPKSSFADNKADRITSTKTGRKQGATSRPCKTPF